MVIPWAIACLSGCTGSLCGNYIVAAVKSPDASHTAYVYTRDCGATTGFSTHVSVIPSEKALPNESGNVLVIGAEQTVQVAWRSSRNLVVGHFAAPVFHRNNRVGSIAVEFEQ